MSDIDPQARKDVNDAITNAGSGAVGQMVDTAKSSIEKRRKNKEEREKRTADEKKKQDAAKVRAEPIP